MLNADAPVYACRLLLKGQRGMACVWWRTAKMCDICLVYMVVPFAVWGIHKHDKPKLHVGLRFTSAKPASSLTRRLPCSCRTSCAAWASAASFCLCNQHILLCLFADMSNLATCSVSWNMELAVVTVAARCVSVGTSHLWLWQAVASCPECIDIDK